MTINLEKELLKANKKLATPAELLVLKEYEQHGDLLKDDSLERVGLTQSLKEGNELKTKAEKFKTETLKFDQGRLFHISQIKKTCENYHLRFLPSIHYSGTIDKELPFKINNFEAAYGVKCQCDHKKHPMGNFYVAFNQITGAQEVHSTEAVQNTFIMAPTSSFKLQERPKDPLLFYKINEEYYYLIHKWGNDLNIFRRLLGFWSNDLNWYLTMLLPSVLAIIFCAIGGVTKLDVGLIALNGIAIAVNTVLYLSNVGLNGYSPFKNKWNSRYI